MSAPDMKFILQTVLPVEGSEETGSPHPLSLHSPLNLDLLLVGGTIKTQQLFNKKERVVEDDRAKQRQAV